MVGLSVSQRTTSHWSFEEDVVYYPNAGFTAIGLWRRKLLEVGEEKAKELLSESVVRPLYLDWAGGFTGSHGWSYRSGIDEAIRFIELARQLGASMVIIHSGARGRHTFNHSRRILREALKELLPVARENGVFLALEPVHPADPENLTFLDTMAETLDFAAQCGPQAKIVYDLGHLGLDETALSDIDRWVGHLGLVQLADIYTTDGQPRRVPLGRGKVPIVEILTTLKNAGYRGPFDIEIWGPHVDTDPPHVLLEQAREFFRTAVLPLFQGDSSKCPANEASAAIGGESQATQTPSFGA